MIRIRFEFAGPDAQSCSLAQRRLKGWKISELAMWPSTFALVLQGSLWKSPEDRPEDQRRGSSYYGNSCNLSFSHDERFGWPLSVAPLVEALGWLGSWPQVCDETSFGKHTFVLIRLQELALEYLYEVELCRCCPWDLWNLPLQRTLQALQMASAQTTASALGVLVLSGCPASSHRWSLDLSYALRSTKGSCVVSQRLTLVWSHSSVAWTHKFGRWLSKCWPTWEDHQLLFVFCDMLADWTNWPGPNLFHK